MTLMFLVVSSVWLASEHEIPRPKSTECDRPGTIPTWFGCPKTILDFLFYEESFAANRIGLRTGVRKNSAARSATNIAPTVCLSSSFSFDAPAGCGLQRFYCCMSRIMGFSAGPIQKCQSVRTVVKTRPGMFFSTKSPSSSALKCRFSPPFSFFLSKRTVACDDDLYAKSKQSLGRSVERFWRPKLVAAGFGKLAKECVGTGRNAAKHITTATIL